MAATATRIDCDIHPAVGGTRTTLLPYLDDHWKEQVVSRAIDGLDLTSYPPNMPLSGRPDWRPAAGKPGSDLKMVQRGAFDQLGASHAICNVLYGASGRLRSLHGVRLLQGDQRLDRGRMAVAGSRACAPPSWCRCRRRILRSRRSSAARATIALFPSWCWRRARCCSAAGSSGRSISSPRNTSCRLRSMPAARTGKRRVRSAGRRIATNITSSRRTRFRRSC